MTAASNLATIIEQAPDMEWLDNAACSTLSVEDLDLFFVGAGKSLSSQARDMCSACPTRRECITLAYDRDIAGGYFGGVSPAKRRSMTLDEALEWIGEPSSC
ncbi:MAG: WhiB family transcriptional regulator [Ilumatobacter sp.]